MLNIIRLHTKPEALPENVVKISTLGTIPANLREAVRIVNCRLLLDNVDGIQNVPTGSLICFEKSDLTSSGYNCWAVATPHTELITIDGVLHKKPPITHAMLIPDKDEARPLWVSNLTYNGDGTATIRTAEGAFTGRIGIDFLLCHGMKKGGRYKVSLLATYDKSYNDYLVCDETGKDLGMLSEIYPA